MSRLAASIESQQRARLPGQRRLAARAEAMQHGVSIAPALIAQFGAPA